VHKLTQISTINKKKNPTWTNQELDQTGSMPSSHKLLDKESEKKKKKKIL